MAKSKVAYLVSTKSPLSYEGKVASCGDVVDDLPGESITWLLAEGFITPAPSGSTSSASTATETPSEPVSDETNGGN